MGESVDKGAYRIAVATIGCALIVVLAGVCVIVAVGKGSQVPHELWTIASALLGGLLGILAPSPAPTTPPKEKTGQETNGPFVRGVLKVGGGLVILGKDIWKNRAIVILLAIFGVSVAFGVSDDSAPLQALAGASGGALIGMLAPSPAKASQ